MDVVRCMLHSKCALYVASARIPLACDHLPVVEQECSERWLEHDLATEQCRCSRPHGLDDLPWLVVHENERRRPTGRNNILRPPMDRVHDLCTGERGADEEASLAQVLLHLVEWLQTGRMRLSNDGGWRRCNGAQTNPILRSSRLGIQQLEVGNGRR